MDGLGCGEVKLLNEVALGLIPVLRKGSAAIGKSLGQDAMSEREVLCARILEMTALGHIVEVGLGVEIGKDILKHLGGMVKLCAENLGDSRYAAG